eukprot:scaffold1428_cov259-Pinguiococcus_pyrenoidosus.AAC.2
MQRAASSQERRTGHKNGSGGEYRCCPRALCAAAHWLAVISSFLPPYDATPRPADPRRPMNGVRRLASTPVPSCLSASFDVSAFASLGLAPGFQALRRPSAGSFAAVGSAVWTETNVADTHLAAASAAHCPHSVQSAAAGRRRERPDREFEPRGVALPGVPAAGRARRGAQCAGVRAARVCGAVQRRGGRLALLAGLVHAHRLPLPAAGLRTGVPRGHRRVPQGPADAQADVAGAAAQPGLQRLSRQRRRPHGAHGVHAADQGRAGGHRRTGAQHHQQLPAAHQRQLRPAQPPRGPRRGRPPVLQGQGPRLRRRRSQRRRPAHDAPRPVEPQLQDGADRASREAAAVRPHAEVAVHHPARAAGDAPDGPRGLRAMGAAHF